MGSLSSLPPSFAPVPFCAFGSQLVDSWGSAREEGIVRIPVSKGQGVLVEALGEEGPLM